MTISDLLLRLEQEKDLEKNLFLQCSGCGAIQQLTMAELLIEEPQPPQPQEAV